MITPILVYTQLNFDSTLQYGQVVVYMLISLSFILGLWIIKTDIITIVERKGITIMTKNFRILLTLLFTLTLINNHFSPVEALEIGTDLSGFESDKQKFVITKQVEALEQRVVSVNNQTILYDISDNPTYLLTEFNEGGYVISTRNTGVFVIYDLDTKIIPYKNIEKNKRKIFGGPLSYFVDTQDNSYLDLERNVIISKELITSLQIRRNSALLLQENHFYDAIMNSDYQKKINLNSSIGIDSSRFSNYSSGKWINNKTNYPIAQGYPSGGICGTIATAIMIAYIDDYKDNTVVPSIIRAYRSSTPASLITSLYQHIDEGRNGTLPVHVFNGVWSWFLDNNPSIVSNYSFLSSSATTFTQAKTSINKGYPVVIGLLKMLGSPYENHWVTAYRYQDNGIYPFYTSYYYVVDNHGSYTARINVNWTAGSVGMYK